MYMVSQGEGDETVATELEYMLPALYLLLNWHFANPKLPFSLTFEPDEIDGRWM
jgi:hypothetical protein